jgi:predicted transcriptional regulator
MLETKPKRRDQLSIVADILEITQHGALKTQIMYKANLSFTQLNEYLTFLVQNNLLIQALREGKETYVVTFKGRDFLRRHNELTQMLKNQITNRKNRKSGVQSVLEPKFHP